MSKAPLRRGRGLGVAFGAVEFVWVPRDDEWIARCDRMARGILEERGKWRV